VVKDVEPKVILLLHQDDFFVDFMVVLNPQIQKQENTKDFLRIIRYNSKRRLTY